MRQKVGKANPLWPRPETFLEVEAPVDIGHLLKFNFNPAAVAGTQDLRVAKKAARELDPDICSKLAAVLKREAFTDGKAGGFQSLQAGVQDHARLH